ncbi:hypothetical protein [Jiulongibacter sp. NS-SX5]|uniref:hypothetical protein n=1 Tax=Jiulongibacter sp. NS-SX5 TaxID=3463854 RepID=UPI0040589A9E
MKKLLTIAVILMGVSTTAVHADDHMYFNNLVESDLTVKALKGLKFKVTAFNIEAKSFVEVKDMEGFTLYREVATEDYAKVLNLASLPDGKYKIILTTGDKVVEEPFEIKTETKVTRTATPSK